MLKNLFARLSKKKSTPDIKTLQDVNSFSEFEKKGKSKNEV